MTGRDTKSGYHRALWTVACLNLGYGVVEMIGGVISTSQALKADALDFLGDGLITGLGIFAIGWRQAWRARAALIQGVFLGILGLAVLLDTGYRIVIEFQPEAGMMGVLGIAALTVNVASAAVLVPHRSGDANVRAVWLFSRSDAVGNLAVLVAAGLVTGLGSPWPDLLAGVVIAALFLHPATSIVREATTELR